MDNGSYFGAKLLLHSMKSIVQHEESTETNDKSEYQRVASLSQIYPLH